MEFSIESSPPTAEEIETEKLRLKKTSKRSRGLFAIGVITCLFMMATCYAFGEGGIAVFIFVLTGVLLIVLCLSGVIEFGLFDPSHQLYQLDTIHEEYCSHALELCEKHHELDQYRRKVIPYRHLVNAEYTMFNEFIRTFENRQQESELENNFNTLHENKEWQKIRSSGEKKVDWKILV